MTVRQQFTNLQKTYLSLFINIVFPLAGLSTDIYLPSLPAMATHFLASKALLQMTVTTYVIAMGIGQLLAGPISDAYGRKRPMLIAILIQVIATTCILFSSSLDAVLFYRFLQGLGAALMMVPARAVINDVFTGAELKKQFGYSTISFALAPIVAPYIGGYLQSFFGWRANFWFILGYDLLVLALLFILFRESTTHRSALRVNHFYHNYASLLSNKNFMMGALFVSIMMGYFSLFSIQGPFLIQGALDKTPIFYGRVALFMGLAWFLGNVCNRLFFRIGEYQRTVFALFCIVVSSIILALWSFYYPLSVLGLSVPIFLMIFFSGSIFPIYVANCLMPFTKLAGSANACLFSISWLFFGIYTLIGATLKATSAWPLSLSLLIVSIVLIVAFYLLEKCTYKND